MFDEDIILDVVVFILIGEEKSLKNVIFGLDLIL